jgi:hypothetical protein
MRREAAESNAVGSVQLLMSAELAERRIRTLHRARVLLTRLMGDDPPAWDVALCERTRQELYALARQIEDAGRDRPAKRRPMDRARAWLDRVCLGFWRARDEDADHALGRAADWEEARRR